MALNGYAMIDALRGDAVFRRPFSQTMPPSGTTR
jgi:hypothetical protein